jgi:ferric-dicitrate binding protein FerR (iron transport regulator)
MQEEPDKYPDQEIEAMMDDLDQEADVDEAWQQFESEKLKVKSEKPTAALPTVKYHSSLRKVAASFVGLLLVSAVAIAAVHIVQHYQKPKAPQVTETTAVNTQLSTLNSQLKEDTLAKAEPVVFDNVTLDSIASDIAAYHHLDMEMQNEQTHQLRFYFVWNPDDSLQEVIEKLNMFEQVNLTVENGKLIVR